MGYVKNWISQLLWTIVALIYMMVVASMVTLFMLAPIAIFDATIPPIIRFTSGVLWLFGMTVIILFIVGYLVNRVKVPK